MRSRLFGSSSAPVRRRADLPEPPPRPWSRLWLPGVLLGAIAAVVLVVLPESSPGSDFLFLTASLIALVVLFGGALVVTGRARPIWWAILTFEVLTMAAVALASVERGSAGSVTFPSVADLVSLSAYVPAFIALGLLIHRLYPGRDREAWIDSAILTVTAIGIFGLFLIAPLLSLPGLDGWAAVVALAYPVLDLALLSTLVWLLMVSHRPTLTLALIAFSVTVTLVADIARDAMLVQGRLDEAASGLAILHLVALMIMAAAAWTPMAESLVRPDHGEARRITTPRLAVVAAGVLTVPTIVAIRLWPTPERATLLLALGGIIVIILAVWRIQILVSAVEQQRRVTELVLDSAGDGIVGLDREGFVLFANLAARRMLRCRESDLVGHRFHDIAHHEHPDGSSFPWQECPIHAFVGSGESSYLPDQRYIRRDGTAFPVEIVRSPLIVDGVVVGAVQSFRDVSEREEMETIKRQFISVVSHELRTPLTSIKGSLQMLDAGVVGPLTGEQEELVTMALANSDRLGKLVNDILDLERLDAGRMPLEPAVTDAGDIARQAVTGMTGAATAAGVRLAVDIPDGVDVDVVVDPHRMIQVLTNLLGNAVKFSDRDATVRLRVRREFADVTIAVIDHGRGIPASQLSTVFERFGQVDAGDARREGGTGLGLAIAQEIVHRSGGTIAVDSTLGHGSTFTVTLPAAHRSAEAETDVPEEVAR